MEVLSMARKRRDPYEGWTHEDFEKEAEELRRSINKSVRHINKEYEQGLRPEMDGPLAYIPKEEN